MKKCSSIFFSLLLVFTFTVTLSAQNDKTSPKGNSNSVASAAVERLQQKILLSDKQTAEITKEVETYIGDKSNLTDSSKLFAQIVPILDARQKIKFEIIRNDWWDNLVKALNK